MSSDVSEYNAASKLGQSENGDSKCFRTLEKSSTLHGVKIPKTATKIKQQEPKEPKNLQDSVECVTIHAFNDKYHDVLKLYEIQKSWIRLRNRTGIYYPDRLRDPNILL